VNDQVAGRCIPLFRPHKWTAWTPLDVTVTTVFGTGPVEVTEQSRRCVRCGRTQVDDVNR
jgi:hypothetical protein